MRLDQCCAAILVGGESRRMGQPKALVGLAGRTLVAHVAEAVNGAFRETLAVGAGGLPDSLLESLGLRAVPDVLDQRSSLNGVLSAIEGSPSEWTAIFACDAPRPCLELLRIMATRATPGVRAVICSDECGALQPFHALWHRAAAAILQEAARRGALKLRDAISNVPHYQVLPAEWREFDPAGDFMFNLNTPDDLKRLVDGDMH